MNVVISDTGPLNYLIQIGLVNILRSFFFEVNVPTAVFSELTHPKAPRVVREWALNPPPWIHFLEPETTVVFHGLGAGELEALALAMELQAELVLSDDLAARDAAKSLGIATAGTIGLLARAHKKGLLNFDDALRRLKATNYRISEEIINEIRTDLMRQN